ncbi:MAG: 23S rRNA (guanosine(2251)-2'-O)-methyltransferase RlmB [Zetaproteobacteria bacterium]|nr:MAG: 23S rRNA (guanosine(2251)-2'-O)-methyltransferase RlmB [Zetaproteobacteria bacterium]
MKLKKNQKNTPALYGVHAVREAWLNEARTINTLYLTEQAQRGFEQTILEGRKKGLRRPEPCLIEKHKLEKMLPRGAVHQGVALASTPAEEHDVQDFIIRANTQARTIICMLDQVTDPHNVGAILRSASAFGIDGVIMQKKHAPSLDGVLAKTACGAVDHIPVAQATNLSRTIKELQGEGFYVIGLDEHSTKEVGHIMRTRQHNTGATENLTDICEKSDESTKIMIVLGSEGDGIRRLVKESCDELVKLPTQGAIASLNVSNAAAVAFYALTSK